MNTDDLGSRVLFDKIRYSNVWEDADILVKALNPEKGKTFFSIASGGDNCFALASHGAEVICADISYSQLACIELKKAAIKNLSWDEVLSFFGIKESKKRKITYANLLKELSPQTRKFWNNNLDLIDAGFIHSGKFERYFSLFRKYILVLIHDKKNIENILIEKNKKDRESFYTKTWANNRWHLLFRLFFSKSVMGKMGRDPEFFKYVNIPVSQNLLKRAEHGLTQLETHNNPYLTYILKGNYYKNLPYYLRMENFLNLKKNIDNIILSRGYVEDVIKDSGAEKFDGFNLSDIFEYLDENYCEKIYEEILKKSRKGTRIAYWNMLVPRKCPEKFSFNIEFKKDLSEKLFKEDKAFFYSRFIIDEVKDAYSK